MLAHFLDLLYLALLVVISPWLLYRSITTGRYREGFSQKFFGFAPQTAGGAGFSVWVHAVSVGEVNLLAPLLVEIAEQRPRWRVVLSTTTKTGFTLARKKYPQIPVFYCPLDFTWATWRAMRRVRPDLFLLAELELWPNLIRAARRTGAQVAVVNGRLSERSLRGYSRLRPLVRKMLHQIDLLAVQSETYAERFVELGARREHVHVTGSLKFDGADTDRENLRTKELRRLAGFREGDVVLMAGSTQDTEEMLVLATYQALRKTHPKLRLVIVPRHPERFDAVARMLESQGIAHALRSELVDQEQAGDRRVLLVDTLGELGAWWGAAHVAFVGGSFGRRGGQNMIEPAAYGAAVCFGPDTQNFRDVVEAMLAADAAVTVLDGDELTQFVSRCLEDSGFTERIGEAARSLVVSHQGATQRTSRLLFELADQRRLPKGTPAPIDARAA